MTPKPKPGRPKIYTVQLTFRTTPATGYKMIRSIYDKADPDEQKAIYKYMGPIYGRAKEAGADVGPPPPVPSAKPAAAAPKS
jgi:hypothetical protein